MASTTTTATMEATEQEIEWAKAIKAEVEKDERLKPLSDLEYVQHAIVAKEKVEKAMKRIHRMQEFKETFGIEGVGTYEDGKKRIAGLREKYKGIYHAVGTDQKDRVVLFVDYSALTSEKFKTQEEWNTIMGAFYYVFSSLQCNIMNIRSGTVFVIPCNLGWSNFNAELQTKFSNFYSKSYPVRIKQIALVDCSKLLVIMFRMISFLIPAKVKATVKMFAKVDQYLEAEKDFIQKDIIPVSMGGNFKLEDFTEKLHSMLEERMDNNASFKL